MYGRRFSGGEEALASDKTSSDRGKKSETGIKAIIDEETSILAVEDSDCRTLISRQWYYVLPSCFVGYLILQALIGSQRGICTIREPFADWTHNVNVVCASCFMLSVCHHFIVGSFLGTWQHKDMDHPRSVYAAAATVSLIAGISNIITIANGYSHICIDSLGTSTYHTQWAEWLVTVPLLGYITCAVDDKTALSNQDIIVIALMFLTILFGFLMNLPTVSMSEEIGILYFIISCICVGGNIYLAMQSHRERIRIENSGDQEANTLWRLQRLKMQARLAWFLTAVLPLFPGVYLLGLFDYFNRDQVVVGNMVCGLIAKMCFVAFLSIESISVQLTLEKRANEGRRRFLRYVLHEAPLLNEKTPGRGEYQMLPRGVHSTSALSDV